MKLKSCIAGAVGVFLFFTGQNLGAQESVLPAPDRDASTLPAPDRDSSTLPPPAGLPSADPAQAPRFAPPAERQGTAPASAGGSAGGSRAQAGSGSAGGQGAAVATPGADAPRRRWPGSLPRTGVYLGAMGGPIFSEYDTDDTEWKARTGHDIDGRTRGAGGLFLGADFGLLIGEVGALLAFERAKIYVGSDSYSARGMSLHIPLLLKMDFHLGPLVLQPLAGPYFNLALGKLDVEDYGDDPYANPPFGLVFGGLLGLNLGRGILFVDSRYEMDLGKTVAGNDPITIWKRSAYVLSFGYQIYLGRRR